MKLLLKLQLTSFRVIISKILKLPNVHFRIDPGLKSTVYCTAIRTGGEKEWQFAFDLYNVETVASEKSRLLSALSCTHKPWLLNR